MASAQLIDNTSSFKNIGGQTYFRAHYDNDFFTNTDYYYTQGITLEYANPAFKQFFLSRLLVQPAGSDIKNGICFNLFGYTPTSINSDSILYGDRPFEGSMSVKLFSISTNAEKKLRVSSALHLGIIGPAALGEEIQANIHRWTGNKIPKGWQYQVRNDIILNYQLGVEKNWFYSKYFLLNGMAELNAGTLNDKLSAGINFMTGIFNDPFRSVQKKKLGIYLYGQGRFNLIGYDASLQGGLFNKKSPYTISTENINRTAFQLDGGMMIHSGKLYFSYGQSFLTKEFKTGKDHRWGGLAAGFVF